MSTQIHRYLPLAATALVLAGLFGVASVLYPNFASPLVVANIFRSNAFLGVIAIGMTFVILSGGIDLSVGTVLAFSTILIAKLAALGWHPALAIGIALGAGTAFGAAQGSLIQVYGLPPFLVTLAGLFFAKGMAFVVHLQSLGIDHPWFSSVARYQFKVFGNAPVTAPTLIFLALLALALVLAHGTRFGRNVYAVGGSESSAVLMGLPVGRTKIAVYAFSGFCAALGGTAYALSTRSGNPAIGLGMELDAIACTVIGGTLLTGGVGLVAGTLLGVLIFGTIKTALDFDGSLDSSWLRIAMGALLLVFIVLQRALSGREAHPD
ncbi:sugar ABC transporter permease YjfF [soil metagenome]